MSKISSSIRGIGFLVLAALIFPLQSVAVKWIGGHYSVDKWGTARSEQGRYEQGKQTSDTVRSCIYFIRFRRGETWTTEHI
jgi:hypothetical protein